MHFRRTFLFNFNVKIINVSLKFLIKVPILKAKFYKNLYINQISQTNFKSFSNQPSDTAWILNSLNSSLPFFSFCISFYTKNIFMFSILFKSHLIGHSGTRRAFKDTQRALEHLRQSEITRALVHSGNWKALRHLKWVLHLARN